jgi:hypothetical protein
MKKMMWATVCAVGACAMYMAVSASEAYAQSGSRLCGWQTKSVKTQVGNQEMKDVHVAIVYEARKAQATYNKRCDEAIKKIKKKLPKTMDVVVNNRTVTLVLEWSKVHKKTCESVGDKLKGQGVPKDICDKMKANEAYKWVKKSSTEAATKEKM